MTDQLNLEYYERFQKGRDDYWRYMAAPRHRVSTILKLVEERSADSLIDIGCGNGMLLSELQAGHPHLRLAGIDLSTPQIEENRRRHPEVLWRSGDVQSQVELDQQFDIATASEIIEHLERPHCLLENACSLVRPGGRLILTTQSGPVRETERRVGHVRHFSVSEMDQLLRSTGWTPLRIWNEGWPFHDASKWWANRDPDRSMSQFSEKGYGWPQRAVCRALRLAFRLNSRRRGAQLFAVAERLVE